MQKFFSFEIATATKDRSAVFQFITLSLFAFSVTVIVIALLTKVSPEHMMGLQQKPQGKPESYAGFVAAPAQHLLHLKK